MRPRFRAAQQSRDQEDLGRPNALGRQEEDAAFPLGKLIESRPCPRLWLRAAPPRSNSFASPHVPRSPSLGGSGQTRKNTANGPGLAANANDGTRKG